MEQPWLDILGKLTTGIYILTTCHKDEFNGMIISWVSQISYDPPLIMIAVHSNRYSHHLLEKNGVFALHVIARNRSDLLECFKGPDPAAKFDLLSWFRGKTGCPILKDCIAYLECEVKERHKPGNHTLFFGEIQTAQIFSNDVPMSTQDYLGTYVGKD